MSRRGVVKRGVRRRLENKDKGLFSRLVRLLVLISIPPFWLEIAILHFRGSFHSRFMWAPLLSLPFIIVGGDAGGKSNLCLGRE